MATRQLADLFDPLSLSEVLQVMADHDRVGCYEDKAMPYEDPGQATYTFVENLSQAVLSSQLDRQTDSLVSKI